jgi:hypothetical protein
VAPADARIIATAEPPRRPTFPMDWQKNVTTRSRLSRRPASPRRRRPWLTKRTMRLRAKLAPGRPRPQQPFRSRVAPIETPEVLAFSVRQAQAAFEEAG